MAATPHLISVNVIPAAEYPLLPIPEVVLFPGFVVTLALGRSASIHAVEEALRRERRLLVVAQLDAAHDAGRPDDPPCHVGTLAEILSVEPCEPDRLQVSLEGLGRVRILQVTGPEPGYTARAEDAVEASPSGSDARALVQHVHDLARRHAEVKQSLPRDALSMVEATREPGPLADLLGAQIIGETAARRRLLEALDPLERLEQVAALLTGDLELAGLEQQIRERVRARIDKHQREYFLREQLKVIQDELGDGGSELAALRARIRERGLPEAVAARLEQEVKRLERMPAISAEATVARTYLDTLLALPWPETSVDNLDLAHAEQVLAADHHGLEPVKERILEYLAVRRLTVGRARSGAGVLCLVGPPGVGKTSLGRSIATAMGRAFVRVSLGGVRDEAEIRGHRRTYVGALPGRIMSALKAAGTRNPVVLLDELDKLAADAHGDPAAALLEVLDPQQNHAFVDHFVEIPYDLSDVLFVATANALENIPRPLRDRLEVIALGGYSEVEKREIGRRHLLPRQLEAHGLAAGQVEVPDEMWLALIRGYTREAGVRGLERLLAAICRKVARAQASGEAGTAVRLTPERLAEYLGPARYESEPARGESEVGVAIGLGTTEAGGELIPVEVAVLPGRGGLIITGRAGEVMQESARAALSYARARALTLDLPAGFPQHYDLHIHLPEGAIPKDGPSAGITMATAVISALTGRPVRGDVAMTGEITLRGRVLPIGGLKEKAIAARRADLRRLIAPAGNRRELAALPAEAVAELEIIWVENMDQVIAHALDFSASPEDVDPALQARLGPRSEPSPAQFVA